MSCPACGGPYASRHKLDVCPGCLGRAVKHDIHEPKVVVPLGVIAGGKESPNERSLDRILRTALEESGQYKSGVIAMVGDGGVIRLFRSSPMSPLTAFGMLKFLEMDIAGEVIASTRRG